MLNYNETFESVKLGIDEFTNQTFFLSFSKLLRKGDIYRNIFKRNTKTI